jgi:hypothetical protein
MGFRKNPNHGGMSCLVKTEPDRWVRAQLAAAEVDVAEDQWRVGELDVVVKDAEARVVEPGCREGFRFSPARRNCCNSANKNCRKN